MRRAAFALVALLYVTSSGIVLGEDGRTDAVAIPGTIRLSLPDTTVDVSDIPAQIPLTVTDFDGIGAMSLRIAFADSILEYVQVVSAVPGVSFVSSSAGSEVWIDWSDETGGESPLSVGTDTLLILEFFVIGESGETSPLDFTSACALADSSGDPIVGVVYVDGSCTVGIALAADDLATADDFAGAPGNLALHPSKPNPFQRMTTIRYDLPREGPVTLQVYDVAGRLVCTLVNTHKGPGRYAEAWNGCDGGGERVAPGVYLYRLEARDLTATRKVVLVR